MVPSRRELPIELQPRDVALLRGLFESRLMTLSHATVLYFDNKPEAAKKRVQKLRSAGLLRNRKRRLYEPSILYLTKAAFILLKEGGHLSDYPLTTWEKLEDRLQVSDLTLRHELSVMDVKAAFSKAIRAEPSLSLKEFSTWPRLAEFNAFHPATQAKIVVKPDGFIRIHQTETDGRRCEQLFFLEVDRSTEVLDTLISRIRCYLDYYKRGGLAEKFHQPRETYRDFPFRVLTVCKSETRCEHIAKRLLETSPPIRSFVWLTTLAHVTREPLGPTWRTTAVEGQSLLAAPK